MAPKSYVIRECTEIELVIRDSDSSPPPFKTLLLLPLNSPGTSPMGPSFQYISFVVLSPGFSVDL